MFPKIHKPEVTHVCLHGNQVYTAGRDGTYRLYDWAKDQLVLLNSSKVKKMILLFCSIGYLKET